MEYVICKEWMGYEYIYVYNFYDDCMRLIGQLLACPSQVAKDSDVLFLNTFSV